MDKNISHFIDRILIDENAIKDSQNGYTLNVDDLPLRDTAHLLDLLFWRDLEFRRYAKEKMESLINERLIIAEQCEHDNENYSIPGETTLSQGAFV